MGIGLIENTMYEVSNLFLLPVLITIVALFVYSFYAFGVFVAQYRQRRQGRTQVERIASGEQLTPVKGYTLLNHAAGLAEISVRDLEVKALKLLDPVRIVTRVAPMLGLVATMIPMGPALKALANGNIQGISESLIIAFTAVIFGLITSSITFWIASVKKQWLMDELNILEAITERQSDDVDSNRTDSNLESMADQEPSYAAA